MAASTWNRNAPFFQEQIFAILGSSSIVVKGICALIISFYCITFSNAALSYLIITPGSLLPPNFYIIPLATSYFVELHVWDMVIDIVIIILSGKLVEPLWGSFEVFLFFIVTNISVSILISLLYLLLYISTFNTDYLFETKIHGMVGYIAGFSVAVKQIMSDHVLLNLMDIRLRNKHVPLCIFVLSLLLWLFGILRTTYTLMYGFGILTSWIYLRFYQRHSNGTKGDMADSFKFASFFPDPIQQPIAVIGNTVFEVLVKLKVCKKPVRKYDISSPNSIRIDLPGSSQDTERRRQKALKALNERLKEKEPEWPNLVDVSDSQGAASPTQSQHGTGDDGGGKSMVEVHAAMDSPLQPLSTGSETLSTPAETVSTVPDKSSVTVPPS